MEVTVQEAKTQLSRLLKRVESGEEVFIRRGQQRVAQIVVARSEAPKRQIWGHLDVEILPGFDDIPEDFGELA